MFVIEKKHFSIDFKETYNIKIEIGYEVQWCFFTYFTTQRRQGKIMKIRNLGSKERLEVEFKHGLYARLWLMICFESD